jgi:UDP-glucose 4-epimerase
VLELIGALRDLGDGRPFEPRHEPARPGEVHRSSLDPSGARTALGWEARTALPEGLRRTLATLAG